MTRQQRVICESLPVIAFIIFGIICGIVRTRNENIEFSKNTTIVIAKLTKIGGVRANDDLYLSFKFHGKLIETMTTQPSHAMAIYRVGSKIRIRVADSIPEDIRFIGVEQF